MKGTPTYFTCPHSRKTCVLAKESPEARTHPLGGPGHPRYSLGSTASLAQNSAAWSGHWETLYSCSRKKQWQPQFTCLKGQCSPGPRLSRSLVCRWSGILQANHCFPLLHLWVGEGCPSCKGQQFSPDCAKTLRRSFHLSERHISNEVENCARLLQIHKIKSNIKWENAPWLRAWDMSSYHCPLVFCRGSNEWQAPSSCFLKAWTGFPGDVRDSSSILGQEDPWRRAQQPTSVFLPGESHGQRNLAGHSP